MKILFICKYNAFRSRVSEEYFNKINKNKKIEVISRGLIMGVSPGKEHVQMSKKLLGVDLLKRKPLPLTFQDLASSDIIFVSADDIPKIIFNHRKIKNKKKIIFWRIKDEQKGNERNIKHIILNIKKEVDELNKQLSN